MKKKLAIAICLIVAALSALVIYRFGIRKSIPDEIVPMQVAIILQKNDCFVCHSQDAERPFYATWPVVGKMIGRHIDHAVRVFDLDKGTRDMNNVSEVPLAMLEHSVEYSDMPILEYRMIHWGTGFNKKEKAILAEWIEYMRKGQKGITPVPFLIPHNPAKAELGERMFNDPRISLDGTISCAHCHLLASGGADENDERTSEGIYGQHGGVNAPTVYNAYFNVQQFWNGRAADLQEQAAGPPVNPVEMGDQTWDQIVGRLSQDKALLAEFNRLYPGEGLTQATVTGAIAEFEKKLVTPDSPFDDYLKGNEKALTEQAIAGYEAFRKNSCATCHTGIILGGKSFEEVGIFADYFAERDPEIAYCSDDDGLKGFTGNDADLHKYKVPGLRNVALTAPYFHDGSQATLEDAVKAMGRYELGIKISDRETASIVAFLKSLTGKNDYLAEQ